MNYLNYSYSELVALNLAESTSSNYFTQIPAVSQQNIDAATSLSSSAFGASVYSPMLLDGLNTEALYRDYTIGLSAPLYSSYLQDPRQSLFSSVAFSTGGFANCQINPGGIYVGNI